MHIFDGVYTERSRSAQDRYALPTYDRASCQRVSTGNFLSKLVLKLK